MQRAEARGSGALWVRCLTLASGTLLSAAALGLGVVGIVLLALEYERSALGALLLGLFHMARRSLRSNKILFCQLSRSFPVPFPSGPRV